MELPVRKSLILGGLSGPPPPTQKPIGKGGEGKPPPFRIQFAVGGGSLDPNNRRAPARKLYCVTERRFIPPTTNAIWGFSIILFS